MSWTKQQFVDKAFEKIGYANYVFDLAPEQLDGALSELDAMMAEWNELNIRLGYPMASDPSSSSLATDTGVPDRANSAIYHNLAIRIAPTVGKTVSAEVIRAANSGFKLLLRRAARPTEMQFPRELPLGAGHKVVQRSPFVPAPEDPLLVDGSELEFD